MAKPPRIAFFPDAYDETNGVARTSRALVAEAASRRLPLLCVRAGASTRTVCGDGDGGHLELARGPASFAIEHDLRHDLLLWRHYGRVVRAVDAFGADLVHVTGPSDIGQLGVVVAHRLGLPLVASWHTNLHEFVARRVETYLALVPSNTRRGLVRRLEQGALWATLQFYRQADVLLAPNGELAGFLRRALGKPTYLMRRGVDTALFSPGRRDVGDGPFRLGFVGRLSREKNVRMLPGIERALVAAGYSNFRFHIVGEGGERAWLEREMPRADFAGVLHGDALARAYANMDLLVFPSETDTFGNVVQEALASGTPALVSGKGGPRFIVRQGVSGYVACDERGFVDVAIRAMADRLTHDRMRRSARRQALDASWGRVLDEVCDAYAAAVGHRDARMAS